MLRSFPVTLAVMLVSGCSTLPQVKRSASSEEKDAKTSAATISQLGVALPAMKPGDERELKIIAADQMSRARLLERSDRIVLRSRSHGPQEAEA